MAYPLKRRVILMKYPIALSQRIDEVSKIVASWPVEKDINHVLNWLMQFDSDDVDLGVRIIRNLNVIGFEDLNTALTIAYSKLERMAIDKGTKISSRNTLFAGIGDSAKSGAMIGYSFRIINELAEDNFMDDESMNYLEAGMIDNIVLVDDIVGTGRQATEEIKILTQTLTPLGVKNIFLLTAVGMQEGIKSISNNTKAHVFSAFEYSELDTVNSLDSPFYDGIPHEERQSIKSRLEYYGKVTNKSAFGYGGIGALIAFYYNTPNISLPVIWGSKNSWLPLFKRAVKINGINSYYKQIESSIAKKKRQPAQGRENEIVILVEGKSDEVFFDHIINLIKDRLPFEKVSVISMGGFGSKKLIENIARLNQNCLFIVEEDEYAPKGHLERFIRNLGDNPYIYVKMQSYYYNLDSLAESDRWSRVFARIDSLEDLAEQAKTRMLEKEIRMMTMRNESRAKEWLEAHLDQEKIRVLKNELVEKIIAQKSL